MVEYPWMRDELIKYVQRLSDPDYQQRTWAWVNPEMNPDIAYLGGTFDMIFDEIEDMGLFDEPENAIGTILENQTEVEALKPLLNTLESLIKKYGNLPRPRVSE